MTDAILFRNRFLADCERQYISIALDTQILTWARHLVTVHVLRALDALQLASAIEVALALATSLIFVASDHKLLNAARNEGLMTDNPLDHE